MRHEIQKDKFLQGWLDAAVLLLCSAVAVLGLNYFSN